MVRRFNKGQHITTVEQERYLMLYSKSKFLVQFLKYFHSVDFINKKTLIEEFETGEREVIKYCVRPMQNCSRFQYSKFGMGNHSQLFITNSYFSAAAE